MTDKQDLRTRIAAVIMRHWEYEPSCTCEDCSLELADAVIRDLGLRREQFGEAEGWQHPKHRHVTDWENDE